MEAFFLTAAAMHTSRWSHVWTVSGSAGLLRNKCHPIMNRLSKLMKGMTEIQLPPPNGTAFKAFWLRNFYPERLAEISWWWNHKVSAGPSGRRRPGGTADVGSSAGFCGHTGLGKRLLPLHTPRLCAGSRISNKTYFIRRSRACWFPVHNHSLSNGL